MVQTINTCEDLVVQIDEMGVTETVKAHRKPPLMSRILRDLYDLYHDQDTYLTFLAHYPLIPSDMADQIASQLDPEKTEIAIGLAGNPRCPQQALNRLTGHDSVAVRYALAANPNLTPKEFQIMVKDTNTYVRAALAENSSLPNPLQFILANDASTAVRIALAKRKNLDIDVAVHLANDSDTMVSAAIILNWEEDDELLQLWADRDHARQQQLLLKRSQPLPHSVIRSLGFSTHAYTCRTAWAQAELDGPAQLSLAQSDDTRDRLFLAEQTDLPASIQRILAQDTSPKVRRRLAANPCINESIARHIASSSDLGACRVLAKNPALSDVVISELCQHPEDEIALLIAYREDLKPEHYDSLINQRSSHVVAEHLAYQEIDFKHFAHSSAEALANSQAPTLRAFVAGSDQLDDTQRRALLTDPSSRVRLALTQNPNLTDQQLQALTADPDRKVVFAAEESLAQRIRARNQSVNTPATPTPTQSNEKAPRRGALFNKIANFFTE